MVTATDEVRRALERVVDPEIPTCSIVDLGMIGRLEVTGEAIACDLLPTFVGCPAKTVIGEEVERVLVEVAGGRRVEVRFVYAPAWTADRVTDAGREALRSYGISADRSSCPWCGSTDTEVTSDFGPTPCRSIHFCSACRNVFEGFKDKGDRRSLPVVNGR